MESSNRQRNEPQLTEKQGRAIEEVISKVKSQGLFDQFRKECLADVDTKPAYHNLIQRVEKFVERFLNSQTWSSDLNKNQLRETLRRQLNNSGVMNIGVDRIIEQVVNPKILLGIKPKIDEAICDYLGIDLQTLHKEQLKRKQQQQQCMLQHHQFQQNPLQNLMNHVKAEDTFGAATGMYPVMNTYPWLDTSVDGNFHGMTSSAMTAIGAAINVDSNSVHGVAYSPHSINFGGMMQPYFMGNWVPGMESFSHSLQPVMSGQSLIHGQPVSAFSEGSFSSLECGAAPFSTAAPPSLECVNTSLGTLPMSIPPPSIPPQGLSLTPLSSSTSCIGSSPIATDISQQSHPVAPPGILTGTAASAIKPPPPGSVPPPPGTVPVIPPASYTHFQACLQPVPATPSINAVASDSLLKELQKESSMETVEPCSKEKPSTFTSVLEQLVELPMGSLPHRLSVSTNINEHCLIENNNQSAYSNETLTEFTHFDLETKRDIEVENGRQTQDMQFDEDPLPLQCTFEDV